MGRPMFCCGFSVVSVCKDSAIGDHLRPALDVKSSHSGSQCVEVFLQKDGDVCKLLFGSV